MSKTKKPTKTEALQAIIDKQKATIDNMATEREELADALWDLLRSRIGDQVNDTVADMVDDRVSSMSFSAY